MPRFFVSPSEITDGKAYITGDDARHIARSLRMAVGDGVEISDGVGTDYFATLVRIRDEECVAEIVESHKSDKESPVRITLYMAMPKGDKLEQVTQKAVELGASRIIPFESERCIKRPAQDKIAKITERLNRIATEAAKQCGRSRLPEVLPMVRLSDILPEIKGYTMALFCYEGERAVSIKEALESAAGVESIAVIVGAEGGFSDSEARMLTEAGAVSVTLGRRILRCETAPDYALAAISYALEL
jgi:16S rRNA (uracil1498-N3)-methyltransferase